MGKSPTDAFATAWALQKSGIRGKIFKSKLGKSVGSGLKALGRGAAKGTSATVKGADYIATGGQSFSKKDAALRLGTEEYLRRKRD